MVPLRGADWSLFRMSLQITVPGGLWGARPSLRRPLAEKLGRQLDKWLAHPGHKNWDQRALQSVVWFHAAGRYSMADTRRRHGEGAMGNEYTV